MAMVEASGSLAGANKAQLAASNPLVSAFVSASAGTGKTKLLTDRLLRLMLAGSPPGRILCLTYTKAAAAEMAIRLNDRLGAWVVAPEPELDAALLALAVTPNVTVRAQARRLFAEVLDLPGGMRIETIHAFCQSLLRRFPLEAGLSPHFELADDADAAPRLREAREAVLAEPTHSEAISAMAASTDESAFAAFTEQLAGDRHDVRALLDEGVEAVVAMQKGALAAGEQAHDEVVRAAVAWTREPHVKAVAHRLREHGNPSGQKWAADILEWLAHEAEKRFLRWVHWVDHHFTKASTPKVMKGFYGKRLAAEQAQLQAEIDQEHERIKEIEKQRRAALLCELNTNMMRLAAPILRAEREARQLAARLSYGDLITLTSRLLIDPGAAWVLYKLDGGIDHLLLDEVQDTAPAQWEIAHALAAEFFAGAGAAERHTPRSIFAVGDEKQSIFSFQGADLESFRTYQAKFRALAKAAGQGWLDGALSTSFRSTGPVLALVDEVFAEGPAREGVCAGEEQLTHDVSRRGQAGAVTLWPLAQAESLADAPAWAVPEGYGSAKSATVKLAEAIAAQIGAALRDGTMLPSRGRPASAGDFLILVRRRNALGAAIMSACKAADIPIAGLDRMVLPEQPAVADLLALCDALLLPADDLAFGQYLASPLGGLSDEALMGLALGRRGSLAAALSARREEFAEAFGFFEALRGRVDYLSPHALLAEALGPLGGRARLLARFGPEAAEPIDELLAEALAFARAAPAALQSFVHHLRQVGASIKREAEASGDMVRIMTVHGAKGLQAPVVILPDTTAAPNHNQTLFWLPVPQQPDVLVPVFCPRAELRCDEVTAANLALKAAERAEHNRLLYVALTRAEDELIVCGAAPARQLPDECWYKFVEAGFLRMGAEPHAGPGEAGRMVVAVPQSAAPDRVSKRDVKAMAALPGWAGGAPDWVAAPPAVETTRPEPLTPSRGTEPEAGKAGAASPLGGDFAQARAARAVALAKGQAVHALLQHLPDVQPAAREKAGQRFLKQAGLPPAARAAVLDSVLKILDDPALAALFGPGSRAEAPLAGVIGGVEMAGLVDRLGVAPAEILLADYKTDRAPPAEVAAVPARYLRQLAAYRAILGQIFPGRAVRCLLIYTETAAVLTVPPAMLDSHAPQAAQPAVAA